MPVPPFSTPPAIEKAATPETAMILSCTTSAGFPPKILLLGSLIQFQFSYARNWPFGAAMAMFLLALVIIVLIFNARMNKRHREYESRR